MSESWPFALMSHCREETRDGVTVSYVELAGDDAASLGFDRAGGLIHVVDVAVADGNVRAEASERRRDCLADANRGTRHDGNAVGQQYGGRIECHGGGG